MIEYVFGILLLVLIVVGGTLFLTTHIAVKKFINIDNRVPERKHHVWVWRIFLLGLVSYSVFLLYANKAVINAYFPGPMLAVLGIALLIYFAAFVEIIIIDFFLPDVVKVWERILIEVLVFAVICAATYFLFNGGMSIIT
jgi:hypothetical protein